MNNNYFSLFGRVLFYWSKQGCWWLIEEQHDPPVVTTEFIAFSRITKGDEYLYRIIFFNLLITFR